MLQKDKVLEISNCTTLSVLLVHTHYTLIAKKKVVEEDFASDLERFQTSELQVATLVIEELKKEQLNIICEKTLVDALTDFVDKEENEALTE